MRKQTAKTFLIAILFVCAVSTSLALASVTPADAIPYDATYPVERGVELDGERILQLPMRTYRVGKATVTFLSVVHVAERALFENHQKVLDAADLILYECNIADAQTYWELWHSKPLRRRYLAQMPNALDANVSGLAYQLDVMHYDASKSIHADIVGSKESLEKACDYFVEFKSWDERILNWFISENQSLQSRKDGVDGMLALNGQDLRVAYKDILENTLVARNKVFMEKLQQHLDPSVERHIVVHYGSAHMPFFAAELLLLYPQAELLSEHYFDADRYPIEIPRTKIVVEYRPADGERLFVRGTCPNMRDVSKAGWNILTEVERVSDNKWVFEMGAYFVSCQIRIGLNDEKWESETYHVIEPGKEYLIRPQFES